MAFFSKQPEAFIDKYKWKELPRAKVWRPKPGERIAGFYRGRTLKNGKFGQYEVVMIFVPELACVYTLSGTVLITTFDAANLPEGYPIMVEYVGLVQVEGTERTWKKFTVFMAETAAKIAEAPRE